MSAVVVQDTDKAWSETVRSWLVQWGRWARTTTERLGYPNSSSITRLVEQAKVFERRQKAQKRRIREARKTGDPKKIAEAYDNADPSLTARGSQTRVMTPIRIGFVEPEIMAVERVIAACPARFRAALFRRYVFNQPDRFAASDLGMEKADYTNRAEAAVDYVAKRLFTCGSGPSV